MSKELEQAQRSFGSATELKDLLYASPRFFEILQAIAELELPQAWLAGGAVRNTVWKQLFADCQLKVKDFDIAFFDRQANRETEAAAREKLNAKFPDLVFDVKNQASFGVWREGRFVFESSEDGIAHWLHTATAVGVRLSKGGEFQVFEPYGLADLFQGIVRPTPSQIGAAASIAKGEEFIAKCPGLKLAD